MRRFYRLFIFIFSLLVTSYTSNIKATMYMNPVQGAYSYSDGSLYIFAFNTGQANCILLRQGHSVYIVDAGNGNNTAVQQITNPEKRAILQQIFHGAILRKIFITHAHTDHYNLLGDILNIYNTVNPNQQPPDFYIGGTAKEALKVIELQKVRYNSKMYIWGGTLQNSNEVYTKINNTAYYNWAPDWEVDARQKHSITQKDGDLTFTILPSVLGVEPKDGDESAQTANRRSFALLVEYNGKKILFGGDYILGNFILSNQLNQQCDIVFLPHHGSTNTYSAAFIGAGNTQPPQQMQPIENEEAAQPKENIIANTIQGNNSALFFICGGNNTSVQNTYIFYETKDMRTTTLEHRIDLNGANNQHLSAQDCTRPLFTTTSTTNCVIIGINPQGNICIKDYPFLPTSSPPNTRHNGFVSPYNLNTPQITGGDPPLQGGTEIDISTILEQSVINK